MGLTTFPRLPIGAMRLSIRLGSVFLAAAPVVMCPLLRRGQPGSVPFWLWPISRFGQSMLTQVQLTVHFRYPCGTSLAPSPPSCWQIPPILLAEDRCHEAVGDVVRWASHRLVTDPACHRRLLLITQQVMAYRSRGRMTRQTRVDHLVTTTLRVSRHAPMGGRGRSH